ncbi:MAG: MFS transporter [Rhodobiaceae bacterium]|nr:MFS transporter [Rhodobiaceae bacterium]
MDDPEPGVAAPQDVGWRLLPIYISAGILLAGNGLLVTLVAVRAGIEGFGDTFIGLVGAAYFTGFLIACIVTPKLIQRAGHIRVFAALSAGAAVSALIMVMWVTPESWLAARLISGFCFCGTATVLESWLNAKADNANRGRLLGVYRVVDLGSVTSGQFMLPIIGTGGFQIFVFAGMLLAGALIPVSLSRQVSPPPPRSARVRPKQIWTISPAAAFGCLSLGLTNSAFRAVGPIYAQKMGLGVDQVALFISLGVLGGAIMNYPIGMLSDRFDRRIVLMAVTASAAAASLFLASNTTISGILFGSLLFGGFALPLYSLSVAHANDHATPDQAVELAAGLILFYGLGAIVGPFLSSVIIDKFGPQAFFVYIATVHAVLILFVLWRMTRRAAVPPKLRRRYVGLLRTSPMFVRLAMGRRRWHS